MSHFNFWAALSQVLGWAVVLTFVWVIWRPAWPASRWRTMSYRDYAAGILFITVGVLVWMTTGWGVQVLQHIGY